MSERVNGVNIPSLALPPLSKGEGILHSFTPSLLHSFTLPLVHMEFVVIIPARYASTRLPGKPLLDIAGKPMVIWVAERAIQSGAKQVVVATDDERIFEAVTQYGFQAIMTKADHVSGTDRI